VLASVVVTELSGSRQPGENLDLRVSQVRRALLNLLLQHLIGLLDCLLGGLMQYFEKN
jgi:hypothetical protein